MCGGKTPGDNQGRPRDSTPVNSFQLNLWHNRGFAICELSKQAGMDGGIKRTGGGGWKCVNDRLYKIICMMSFKALLVCMQLSLIIRWCLTNEGGQGYYSHGN